MRGIRDWHWVSALNILAIAVGRAQMTYFIYSGKKVQDHQGTCAMMLAISGLFQQLRSGLQRTNSGNFNLLPTIHPCLKSRHWQYRSLPGSSALGLKRQHWQPLNYPGNQSLPLFVGKVPHCLCEGWGSAITGWPQLLSLTLRRGTTHLGFLPSNPVLNTSTIDGLLFVPVAQACSSLQHDFYRQ